MSFAAQILDAGGSNGPFSLLPKPSTGALLMIGFCTLALLAIQILPYGDLSFPGVFMDSYEYLKMAAFFSPWLPQADASSSVAVRYSQFPPLYPLVLALFGGGGTQVLVSYFIHSIIFCALFGALAAWMASLRLAWSWAVVLSFLLCLTTWLHLSSVRLCSEPLFLCLCALAYLRADHRVFLERFDVVLVALIAMAALTRSAGWFLIAALLFSIWRASGSAKSAAAHALFAALPILLWTGAKALVPGARNYAEIGQGGIAALSDNIAALLLANAKSIFFAINPSAEAQPISGLIAAMVLVIAAPTFLRRIRAATLDALFVLLYLPIVLVWPYASDTTRLMLPISVAAIVYATVTLAGRFQSHRHQSAALTLFALIVLLPAATSTLLRVSASTDDGLAAFKKQDFYFLANSAIQADEAPELMYRVVATLQEVAQRVPAGECIYASQTRISDYYSERDFVFAQINEVRQDKLACRYTFFAPLSAAGPTSNVDAMAELQRRSKPILVNEMNWGGQQSQVAVLASTQ